MIDFADFEKLDIKIGTIVSAEKIPQGDKLLRLQVDLGNETRQIMAGIAEFISNPEDLVGKQVPVLANLKPRTLRGYESQGMMLAVGSDEKSVLLYPNEKVPNGSRVR